MSTSAPTKPDLEEYADWLWSELGVETATLEAQYERVSAASLRQVEASPFWRAVLARLPDSASRYYVRTGYLMWAASSSPELTTKSWASFWLKTYRRNITDNGNWPLPPQEGWWTPDRWHEFAKDVVRTRIVVRYLDAVIDVAGLIEGVARRAGHRYSIDLEATDAGYYAAHAVIYRRLELPTPSFSTRRTIVPIEIQVTTEVKDVVQELLHRYYETMRTSPSVPTDPTSARWNYASAQFRSTYLGHMAHYLEGIIMDLRTRE